MSGGESNNSTLQKSTVESQPPVYSMRLVSTSDGTAVYKTIGSSSPPPTQGAGGSSDGPSPPTLPRGFGANVGEPLKRKRGRPRKYAPDGAMALAMAAAAAQSASAPPSSGGFSPSPPSVAAMASTEITKKARGRAPGSSKKQQMEALGSAGAGFVPHFITVKTGEDVASKIMSFSQNGPQAVCILSANGAISNMTLRQAATSGGSVTYEGLFEILSLSGSYLLSESGGQRSRTGGLSVSLASPDGRVLGGGVAGPLVAASPVQVVVGSFILNDKSEASFSDLASAPGAFVASCGMMGNSSPPSRGTASESSGGPGSPLNQSTGVCNNNHQQGLSSMPWK